MYTVYIYIITRSIFIYTYNMYIYIYLYVYISYYRIDISAFLTPDQPREADNLNVKDRFLETKTA